MFPVAQNETKETQIIIDPGFKTWAKERELNTAQWIGGKKIINLSSN